MKSRSQRSIRRSAITAAIAQVKDTFGRESIQSIEVRDIPSHSASSPAEAVEPGAVFRGIPRGFPAAVRKSTHRAVGYTPAGLELARYAMHKRPRGVKAKEWRRAVERLRSLITERQDSAVLAWFDGHFPGCMERVPRTGRLKFLRGIYFAGEEEAREIRGQ